MLYRKILFLFLVTILGSSGFATPSDSSAIFDELRSHWNGRLAQLFPSGKAPASPSAEDLKVGYELVAAFDLILPEQLRELKLSQERIQFEVEGFQREFFASLDPSVRAFVLKSSSMISEWIRRSSYAAVNGVSTIDRVLNEAPSPSDCRKHLH